MRSDCGMGWWRKDFIGCYSEGGIRLRDRRAFALRSGILHRLGQLQQVVNGADQAPFALRLRQTAQHELPEPASLLDLAEDRLYHRLAQPVPTAQVGGRAGLRPNQAGSRVPAVHVARSGEGARRMELDLHRSQPVEAGQGDEEFLSGAQKLFGRVVEFLLRSNIL